MGSKYLIKNKEIDFAFVCSGHILMAIHNSV